MKTFQDLYDEITKDDGLKRAFVEALRTGKEMEFLREQGVDGTKEEIEEFLAEKEAEENPLELSVEKLKLVAGGTESILTQTVQCPDTNECSNTCIRDCC